MGNFKTAQSMFKTTQFMWNACSKHFTLIGLILQLVLYQKYISKLPNQCENIWNFLGLFQNCLINVKCLQQAFHMNWAVVPKIYFKTAQSMWKYMELSGAISKLPNQCENIWNFLGLFQNCLINVKCLQQAFHMNWAVVPKIYFKTAQSIWKYMELSGAILKLPNQCEMLAASITHWLGTFHFWLTILVKLEKK